MVLEASESSIDVPKIARQAALRTRFARYVQIMSLGPMDPIDFSTHVLSLASSAMVALGRVPGPDGKTEAVDLEMARQLVDVIAMLEIKTRGNLDEGELKLLQSLLYDLRVACVDVSNAQGVGK